MASSQLLLAYAFHEPEQEDRIAVRLRHADRHLGELFRPALTRTAKGDGRSGLMTWTPVDSSMGWESVASGQDRLTAWLHLPSVAGPAERQSADEIADRLLNGRLALRDLAAPFGLVRWTPGRLDIVNDALGLVRLFQFEFAEATVWSTRPGLAHVFMGIAPAKNEFAWSGMASVGWSLDAATQLGEGRQVPPAHRITVLDSGMTTEDHFAQWFTQARHIEVGLEDNVRDMRSVLLTSRLWRDSPTADLSGGMDSRTVAAVGITCGAVDKVRTLATDHGEVQTAQRLVELAGSAVHHTIVRPAEGRTAPNMPFGERLAAQHRAWEGRYLATSAFNAAVFSGFRTSHAARFNGLGGEFAAGGQLARASSHELLMSSPPGVALDRLAAMVRGGLGITPSALESTVTGLERMVPAAGRLGLGSALGVLDLTYMIERMPYWSNVYASAATLTPLFAASLLAVGVQHAGAPAPPGELQHGIIRTAFPDWAEVPFYSPTRTTRAVPFVWQTAEWSAVKDYLDDRVGSTSNFDPDLVAEAARAADEGRAGKREEFLFHRLLWELTFSDYVVEVGRQARAVARELASEPSV